MADREPPGRFPPDIDLSVPSVARMYDYILKGKDNFEVDRAAVDAMLERVPEMFRFSYDSRAFLTRAVETVAAQGLDQFLDLGAGLPTNENTHQVARRVRPGARTVYVDNDPIVLAHGRAILADNPGTAFVLADIRDTDRLVSRVAATQLIDLDRPVCLMLVSLLQCVPDAHDPFGLLRRLLERLAPGSALIYSHMVSDDPATRTWLTEKVLSLGTAWGRVRTPEEAGAAFTGLDLVDPDLGAGGGPPRPVDCATWRTPGEPPADRPRGPAQRVWETAGVAFTF
ncbi:SAM-dependent methyltransferase [Nocardiopsis sediminis]|uniref:SAM-dependent methyltransferase n=1 Tax=Nocardiopsis sediminis TaxID=1778267 RepID=A0ABV8FG25_9ACTN